VVSLGGGRRQSWRRGDLVLRADARKDRGHEKRPRDGESETEWGVFFVDRGGRCGVGSPVRTDADGWTPKYFRFFVVVVIESSIM